MSENQDESQKTEEPTPRKLEEARKKGQVSTSKEVNSFAILLGAGAVVMASPWLIQPGLEAFRGLIEVATSVTVDRGAVQSVFIDLLLAALLTAGPVFALLMFIAVAANIAQSGFIFSAEPLKFELNRISPISGFKRLFSLKSVVELLKGVFKMVLVAGVVWLVLVPEMERLESLLRMDVAELLGVVLVLITRLMIAVLALLAAIALIDYLYQRYEFMKQMRMTLQEVKDEFKQSDGDPQVRARLRQIRAERARQRMMQAVSTADVVVTNPTHFAVAMKYEESTMAAPLVVAKGADEVALRIRELAGEHKIPLVENPPLARALFDTVEIDQEVPPEHYKAVAEVIGYVMRLRRGRA
ncbi:MAG: flagellar biosynthesis protein FlhB, partial [Thalassobaculaceae bacterium]